MAGRRHTRRTAPSPPRPPEDPAQGVRTRQAGRNAAAGPPPPTAARAASSGDQARWFAGLSSNQTAPATQPRSTGTRQPPAVNPAPSGARASPAMIFPQTPARRAVNGLADQFAQAAAMASPGPRLRDPIETNPDVEDSDGDMSDDFPVIPRTRPLRAPTLLPAAESDDENPPPRAPARTRGTSRHRGRGSAAAPTHAATTNDNEPGSVYVFIQPETLVKTKKSADSDYFFGRCEIDKGFKCRLCPCAFSFLFDAHTLLKSPQARVQSWFKSYHPPPSPSKY
ncbi:hypothetical protein B0H10DRAFT_2297493 [Mycena sp. CBHHK59/15]|nr:hypothetical protein B0H10DRAFT_2297493 [Mycena sp. CBHHK59/15]